MRQVWITGMGAVSAAGVTAESLVPLLTEGRSALGRDGNSEHWEATAPLPENRQEARRLDRGARLFLCAAREAWANSGLDLSPQGDRSRIGVIEGSSLGAMGELIEESRLAAEEASRRARRLIRFMPGAGGAAFAQEHAIGGPVMHLSAGSVSATVAVGEAFLMVGSGRLDLAVAGGGEAPLHPDVLATFRGAGILSRDQQWPCRPFDSRRDGTVLGEGSGAVVLEAAEHARRRGARPLGILGGYATGTESGGMVAPNLAGTGVASTARAALKRSSTPGVAWIKAHGTGTVVNDLAECRGLALLFGPDLPTVPISSLKSTLGHTLGASGALELVAALVAIRQRCVPATVGSEQLDAGLPACTVATTPRTMAAGDVLLLSESFGGRAAALVVGADSWL